MGLSRHHRLQDAAIANDNFDSSVVIKQLYPDQETYKKEEQRRFEILDAHWDLPIRMWIWRRADFLGIRVPCTGDLPADRQSLRRIS